MVVIYMIAKVAMFSAVSSVVLLLLTDSLK